MEDYHIGLSQNQKFIYIDVIAPVTFQLAVAFTNSLTLIGKNLNLFRAVINIRSTKSVSSIYEKYIFAYERAELSGLSRSWRIALLKELKDTSPDFLETVMINAGYQFKMFTDEQFAVDWLDSDVHY